MTASVTGCSTWMRAVQLEEEELAAGEHELRRARADVPDRAREGHSGLGHARAEGGVERRGRRLLEHLLVAPLHRALALAEPEHGAVPVGEELDLDVPRPLEVALEEQPAVAEGRQRLASGRGDGVVELVARADDPHPAAAAAGRRLDEQRQPSSAGAPPGTTGTAAAAATPWPSTLSPAARSASGGGPIQ